MKSIIMVRHAKSDWSNLYLPDIERTLNERGLRDAKKMGQLLLARNVKIDFIIASTAKRAAQTAMLIAKELGLDTNQIQWSEELYHAPPSIIEQHIETIDATHNHVMIVCHNPGITHFVNSLQGHITDNIPTCGMAAFAIEMDKGWEDFHLVNKRLMFYDFPKNHL